MTVHPPINDAEFNTVIGQRDSARSVAAQLEAENARLIDAAADVEVLRRELAAANADNRTMRYALRAIASEIISATELSPLALVSAQGVLLSSEPIWGES